MWEEAAWKKSDLRLWKQASQFAFGSHLLPFSCVTMGNFIPSNSSFLKYKSEIISVMIYLRGTVKISYGNK